MTTAPVLVEPVEQPVPLAAPPRPRPSNEEIAAWVLLGGLLVYVLLQHLVSAVITGLVLYLILARLATSFSKRIPGGAAAGADPGHDDRRRHGARLCQVPEVGCRTEHCSAESRRAKAIEVPLADWPLLS